MSIKQILDTESMIIDSQSFLLKNYNEPLDNSWILLRLQLFVRQ